MLRIFVALFIVVLFGCNQDNSDSNDGRQSTIPEIYFGEFVIDGSGSSSIYAVISEDRQMRLMFFSLLGQAIGQLTSIDNSYGAFLALYQNYYENVFYTKSDDIELELNVTSDSINGIWSDSSISSGRIHLSKLSDVDQITDPVQLASNWLLNIASSGGSLFTLSLSIDSRGIITGSDKTGCMYHGSIVDINKVGRVVPFEMSVTSCGLEDGPYQGHMVAVSTASGDKLVMLASNTTYSFAAELNR